MEVAKLLVEAGGRELLMLTTDDGISCLIIAAGEGHLEVAKLLVEAGGRELLMLTAINGWSCLCSAAEQGHF